MNDDLVVQKILKLLENNTAFIGYALNGGIGTKINVRNTETGKTIQAVSINVDSSGEVLVVKDSDDGKYKAVTFRAGEQVTERIIQIRKTKPVDDKKIVEYTDADIEVFYLFVKLIDTGSPYPTQLQSTWIRKGSSCTQFVGAYERCNYAAKETIGGTSYTGLPYKPYNSLNDCLADDLGRDAKTPHGTGDENGANLGWKIYATTMTAQAEENLRIALESHDAHYGTSYKKLFGYGTILECSGSMYVQGWEVARANPTPQQQAAGEQGTLFFSCDFSYLPGFTTDCTLEMRDAGYCDNRGFINSKTPPPGTPGVGNIDNSWAYEYGWIDLPYEFMYKRHFFPLYLNGQHAQGSFLILEVNDDQTPNIPEGYYPWVPGCPSNLGNGGPYNGTGGNRFPDGPPKLKKRDMKLSTHKAEIWLGSSQKEEAIKLYELGASDLFSGMYNAFILAANESQVDIENRLKRGFSTTIEDQLLHETFYKNWNKNIIDLRIDPRVWIYVIDNIPTANYVYPSISDFTNNPRNQSLQLMVDNLYNRTVNLTIIDKKTQVIHLKLGLTPRNSLSNTDCKGNANIGQFPVSANEVTPSQSWEYQKYVTIKIKNWEIESTTNVLDTTDISDLTWNKNYIKKKFFTLFGSSLSGGGSNTTAVADVPNNILLRDSSNIELAELTSGNHYEQYNYNHFKSFLFTSGGSTLMQSFASSYSHIKKQNTTGDTFRRVMKSTSAWWAFWDKTTLNGSTKRLSSVVGFDFNYYQILTCFGLNPNLNYTASSSNRNEVRYDSYFIYLTTRPLVYLPSNIRSAKNKFISSTTFSFVKPLLERKILADTYGLHFPIGHIFTQWYRYVAEFRADGITAPFLGTPSDYYAIPNFIDTKENSLYLLTQSTSSTAINSRRFNTTHWINKLWTQLVYDGSIKVDVESYKNVEFSHPTNPAQYIKYTTDQTYANSEYNFVLNKVQNLETVLTPGVLDVTKQVPIKKPTNVELDPNMSFLVYLYPFVSVTKKTKEI